MIPISLRIWWLKRKLRSHYARLRYVQSGEGGRHITNVITGGGVTRAAQDFNAVLKELKAIDPGARDLPYQREE